VRVFEFSEWRARQLRRLLVGATVSRTQVTMTILFFCVAKRRLNHKLLHNTFFATTTTATTTI
jgi:hypothetical protein